MGNVFWVFGRESHTVEFVGVKCGLRGCVRRRRSERPVLRGLAGVRELRLGGQ